MAREQTKTITDVLEQAAVFTIAGIVLIVGVMVAAALFIGSLAVFDSLLGPVLPDGLPSLLILVLATIPPVFFAGVVAALLDLGPEVDDDE